MHAVAIITVLALLEYMVMGIMVGRARTTYGVAAPATTGNPDFERYYRVHQNTLEALLVFIPALWLFAQYASIALAVALGLIFLAGRFIYAAGYIRAAEKRGPGALITFAVNGILLLGGLLALLIKSL
jgi:glutathione S-transferase